jgi:hypothetical protein
MHHLFGVDQLHVALAVDRAVVGAPSEVVDGIDPSLALPQLLDHLAQPLVEDHLTKEAGSLEEIHQGSIGGCREKDAVSARIAEVGPGGGHDQVHPRPEQGSVVLSKGAPWIVGVVGLVEEEVQIVAGEHVADSGVGGMDQSPESMPFGEDH